MLSQLPTAERCRLRLYRATRRALEIWSHVWLILLMLAASGAFWACGWWLAKGMAR